MNYNLNPLPEKSFLEIIKNWFFKNRKLSIADFIVVIVIFYGFYLLFIPVFLEPPESVFQLFNFLA
jgi:hypothetical protein